MNIKVTLDCPWRHQEIKSHTYSVLPCPCVPESLKEEEVDMMTSKNPNKPNWNSQNLDLGICFASENYLVCIFSSFTLLMLMHFFEETLKFAKAKAKIGLCFVKFPFDRIIADCICTLCKDTDLFLWRTFEINDRWSSHAPPDKNQWTFFMEVVFIYMHKTVCLHIHGICFAFFLFFILTS